MAARLVGNPDQQFFKNDGSINAGGTLTFYEPGTTTPKTIYSTSDTGGATHTNPHTLDSAGRPTAPIFTDGLYDILVKDSAGSTLVSVSNYGDNNSAVATDLSNLVLNASFETDTNADGTPDNWTLTPHANITIARSTSSPGHGAACLLFTVTGAGTADATSALFELSNLDTILGSMKAIASAAGLQVSAYLKIYDNAQSLLSTQTIFQSTNNSTSWAEDTFSGITVGDHEVTGRYGALKLEVSDNGNTGTVCFDGVTFYAESSSIPSLLSPQGLKFAQDTDTAHDLSVTAGSATADDGAFILQLDAAIVKRFDAAWAAGTGNGGMDTGSMPIDGIIYLYLIGSSTTGAVDVLGSISATSPTMPSGYDKKRLVFAWPTDGSGNCYTGTHSGDTQWWAGVDILQFNDTTMTDTVYETATVQCPANCVFRWTIHVNLASPSNRCTVGVRPTSTTLTLAEGMSDATGNTTDEVWESSDCLVDGSSQLDYVLNYGTTLTAYEMYLRGFDMITRNQI